MAGARVRLSLYVVKKKEKTPIDRGRSTLAVAVLLTRNGVKSEQEHAVSRARATPFSSDFFPHLRVVLSWTCAGRKGRARVDRGIFCRVCSFFLFFGGGHQDPFVLLGMNFFHFSFVQKKRRREQRGARARLLCTEAAAVSARRRHTAARPCATRRSCCSVACGQ